VWFNSAFLDPAGVPHPAVDVLLQVTGNRFTTATTTQEISYFRDTTE
jgi:hypothetical protein